MGEKKKTVCVLCANNCGLEVEVENNRIVKVRGDKDNPRTEGYLCRKGANIAYYQHHADRLTHPLKKVNGSFERIPWDKAIDEIAGKLSYIVNTHGPRSLAMMLGGGLLGCPSQGPFAVGLLRAMGSQYCYSALAQELTGRYWVDGETFGNQDLHSEPDMENTDFLMMVGKNPIMSHHLTQARRIVPKITKDPKKTLVVVDPRVSETAKIANIHLPIRPGTDALLLKAMISIILKEGWQDQKYIGEHVNGFEAVRPLFQDFDARAALAVCELDFDQVKEICRLYTTRSSSHMSDLGVLMTRHSTLISYLETVFRSITGRIGVKGGNIFPPVSGVKDRGKPSPRERQAKAWRTVASDFPMISGVYPPNVMPEEILSDHPDRLRAVLVTGCNPLRSYADTTVYEEAFQKLDLLVTVEISMTETASLAHYVLPALSGYESWDGGPRAEFPRMFLQFRGPVVKAEGEQLEAGEIFTRLADRLGLLPNIPASLYDIAGSGDRLKFGAALGKYLAASPAAGRQVAFVLAKTLGKSLGSVQKASFWGRLQNQPPTAQEAAARVGFTPGPKLGEDLFRAALDNPQGLIVGEVDPETWDHFQALSTADGKIHLDVREMKEWLKEIDPSAEAEELKEGEEEFPLILSAGRHWDVNANTQMRNPEWNSGRKRVCTLTMHPEDAKKQGLVDGQTVRVITEAGQEVIELQVTDTTRPGYVVMPQGFGLVYQGKQFGANANRLAKNTHRDRLAATPLHRYIRCRVEAES